MSLRRGIEARNPAVHRNENLDSGGRRLLDCADIQSIAVFESIGLFHGELETKIAKDPAQKRSTGRAALSMSRIDIG
jgi:hypothetical protein